MRCVALAIVIAFFATCNAPPPPQTEDITIWQPRGHWSGQSPLQTDPFISTTGLLRVTWQSRILGPPSRPDNSTAASARSDHSSPGNSSRAEADTPATLRIVLHSDVSGRSLAPVVEHTGGGSGVKYISEDPRSFFFVIESNGVEWDIEVAEGLTAQREKRR